MAKLFSISTEELKKETKGILYVLVMRLDCGKEFYKIGVTQRSKIEERVAEIVTGFFIKYRYFPYCYPKRFKSTEDVYAKEAVLHNKFKEFKYETEYKFGGSTEMFAGLALEEILEAYENII